MKKTLLASAIGLTLGFASSVQAQTITITQMQWGGELYGVSGTMNSNGDGFMQSTDNFNGHLWVSRSTRLV